MVIISCIIAAIRVVKVGMRARKKGIWRRLFYTNTEIKRIKNNGSLTMD